MKLPQRVGVAITAAVLLTALGAAGVLGYGGQVSCQVSVAVSSGALAAGSPATVSATVRDANGKPVAAVPVDWSITSGSQPGDTISPATTTTNAAGVATTTVTLADVPGSRSVVAVASQTSVCGADVSSGAVLGIAGGLPNTSTDTGSSGTPAWGLVIVALAALAGLTLGTRALVGRRQS